MNTVIRKIFHLPGDFTIQGNKTIIIFICFKTKKNNLKCDKQAKKNLKQKQAQNGFQPLSKIMIILFQQNGTTLFGKMA